MSKGVDPTLNEAANALFTPEEKQKMKENLIGEQITQAQYLRAHPEIEHTMRLAIAALVQAKPDDAVGFLTAFFADNDLEKLQSEAAAQLKEMQWRSNSKRKESESRDDDIYQVLHRVEHMQATEDAMVRAEEEQELQHRMGTEIMDGADDILREGEEEPEEENEEQLE